MQLHHFSDPQITMEIALLITPPLCFSSGRKAESAESIVVQSTAPVPIKSSLRRDRESANREENAC